jgi:LmbE family N-acetylglucosaminyl deacetylase
MHLFLSPHYDDAVYSCGGQIAQLTRAGQTARVYTVMGAKPPETLPDTPIVQELHARWKAGEDPVKVRRQEDETAVYLLDGQVGYNNAIPDCVYRTAHGGRPLYPDEASLFGVVDPDDPAITALELKLPTASQLWQDIQFDEQDNPVFIQQDPALITIYAPLGVGNHVDHQIVRDWAFKLHQTYPTLTLMLYEDFPYSREAQMIEPLLAALPVSLTRAPQALDDAAIQAKITAVAAYATQFNTFWTDEAALVKDVRTTLVQRGGGTPSEMLYRVSSANFAL